MKTLTLIQIGVFCFYILFLLIRFGKPLSSISSSWYRLKGKQKWLFTLFCWGVAIPMFYQGGFLFELSALGIAFTGVAVNYKGSQRVVPVIHYTGAVICIAFAFAGLYFEYGHLNALLVFLIVSAIHIGASLRYPVWWIEIYAFLTIAAALLSNR